MKNYKETASGHSGHDQATVIAKPATVPAPNELFDFCGKAMNTAVTESQCSNKAKSHLKGLSEERIRELDEILNQATQLAHLCDDISEAELEGFVSNDRQSNVDRTFIQLLAEQNPLLADRLDVMTIYYKNGLSIVPHPPKEQTKA